MLYVTIFFWEVMMEWQREEMIFTVQHIRILAYSYHTGMEFLPIYNIFS